MTATELGCKVGEGLEGIPLGDEQQFELPSDAQEEGKLAQDYIDARLDDLAKDQSIVIEALSVTGLEKYCVKRGNGLVYTAHAIVHTVDGIETRTAILQAQNGHHIGISSRLHAVSTTPDGSSEPVNGSFNRIVRPFAVLQKIMLKQF